MSKGTQRIDPSLRLVNADGLLTREGFNVLRELFDQVQDQATLTVYTAAQIADASHQANTQNKAQGRQVWDSTNNRVLVAEGAAVTDQWHVADGSASVTPA